MWSRNLKIVVQNLISCQSKDEESQWESRPLILQMSKPELEGPENHPQEEAVSFGHLLHSAGFVVCMGFLAAGHWTLFGNFGKEAGEHKYSSLKIYHSIKNKKETKKWTNKQTKKPRLSHLCTLYSEILPGPATMETNSTILTHSENSCPGPLESISWCLVELWNASQAFFQPLLIQILALSLTRCTTLGNVLILSIVLSVPQRLFMRAK